MDDYAAALSGPSERPFLSPGEWRIFSLLARYGPLTVREIREELAREGREALPGYTTLATLATRLVAKGYLSEGPKAASRGPTSVIVFSTTVPYDEALRLHTLRFLAQFALGGSDDLLRIRQVIEQNLSG